MTAKQKKKLVHLIKDKIKRSSFLTFAIYFFFTSISTFAPLNSFALTGGPSQPEVQSFEPIGTSDMVNLFSGDLTYNIPLLDIDGYPVNIAYNGGVTTDQEASWTGLGWNINVGTINRALRGLPDDFKDEIVTTETNINKNWTVGIGATVGDIELFGLDLSKGLGVSIGFGLGVEYNNYTGVGSNLSFNAGLSLTGESGVSGNVGLGLNSSSSGGLSISPSAGLSARMGDQKNRSNNLGGSIGSSFNSRSGLAGLSIGANLTSSKTVKKGTKKSDGDVSVGATLASASASFDFQQPTYTPSITNSMRSYAVSARFIPIGVELFGTNVGLSFSINYSEQTLKDKILNSPSYGYLYSEAGQYRNDARHDFNREKDGSYTASTPNLPLTNYTYDIYSVSGQGVGGSYRPYRNQVGYVFDNDADNKSNSFPITVELGLGNISHFGGEIGVVHVNSTSGKWLSQNNAKNHLDFNKKENAIDFENVVFREANEASIDTDSDYYDLLGKDSPVKVDLLEASKFNVYASSNLSGTALQRNYRKGRVKRNSTIQNLTIEEVNNGVGINYFMQNSLATTANAHHIGQIISLGNDGLRYVYGQPAYNKEQQEVTFAVGASLTGSSVTGVDYPKGLVSYTPNVDNSTNNAKGLDNYFQRVTTPAYAHSYLLTAVVSDDYVDTDNIKGPSDRDLGTYTKFSYERINNYKWRVPVELNKASYNEGLKTDIHDDKANYIYGEKELFYLDTIQTKNFIAIFDKEDRQDGLGVINDNGGVDNNSKQKVLTQIRLYSKPDYKANGNNATPIKTVHFVYDYSLCPNVPNNSTSGQGKLTLKKVYFTYRDSKKGKLSPYVFTYKSPSTPYHLKAYDRWGNYKAMNPGVSTGGVGEPLPTFEFPYVDQNKILADTYATTWILSKVELPSGGEINIETETDDYAYVQQKKAMEMAKIVNVSDIGDISNITENTNITPTSLTTSTTNFAKSNRLIWFKKNPSIPVSEYVKGIDNLYFRCLMEFDGNYDYVSGYAEIETYGINSNGDLGWIQLKPLGFGDNSGIISPITIAATQFARLHLPNQAYNSPTLQNSSLGVQFITSIWSSISGFITGFENPNKTAFGNDNGTNMILNKSWIRLNDVDNRKFGGGHRVSKIEINDNWEAQTDQTMSDSKYGQVYEYTNKDGSSSGVASYEPQMGGDENPWKQPIRFSTDKKWAPDDRFFQETPFGESFFPSASVGYARVVVKNLPHPNVSRNATGFVEHTFYTAKDYPTIAKKTSLENKRHKNGPFSITSLFKINVKDYYTGSQGYVVITNDMHGKPKSQEVYAEGQTNSISKVEYFYKDMQSTEASTKELTNNVPFIHPNGNIVNGRMGVNVDMVADFRQSKTDVTQASGNLNNDNFLLGIIPVLTFTIIPSYTKEKTQFRSAVLTKVVQKFGVLESTVATDLGSKVETKNMAYDSETGQVLLTETTTNFNDKVYSLNFPAYWYYDNMGQAYKNIGLTISGAINSAGIITTNHAPYFVPGDEVALSNSSTTLKAWVIATSNNTVAFQLASGAAPAGTFSKIKIIRSGRRNLTSQMMTTVTTLTNPLNTIKNNIYENVLQASAIEYTDEWRTYCDCNDNVNLIASTNPYFLGIKGNYKPKISYLHLSNREQSDYNNNTNIRKDGTFESYLPFYKLNSSGKWIIDRKDWTFTSQVTEFNPFGQELENQDALGRYSAATFGFNQTLPKSVAANSRYRETGFTSFEDEGFSECADNHFKFNEDGLGINNSDAHSGKYSIKVDPNNTASLKRELVWCDQTGCEVTFAMLIGANLLQIDLVGYSGAFTTGFQVISGSPYIIPTPTGFEVVPTQGQDFIIEFNAVDDKGCQTTNQLSYIDDTPLLSANN